jgi:hypothetical protein
MVDLLGRTMRGAAPPAIVALLLLGCTTTSSAPSSPPTASGSTVPSAEASESSAPSIAPTPAPSDTSGPTAGGSIGARFNVDLVLSTGRAVQIEVKDDSGMLSEAASGTPGDGASVSVGTIDIKNVDPSVLQLTWSGPPCATDNFLLIEGGASRMTVVQPTCTGDAIALDRVLLLTFSGPISAGTVEAILQAGGDPPG